MFHSWRAYFPVLSEVSAIRNNLVLILLARISGWNWYRWETNTPFFRKGRANYMANCVTTIKEISNKVPSISRRMNLKTEVFKFSLWKHTKCFPSNAAIFLTNCVSKKTRLGKGISWLSVIPSFSKSRRYPIALVWRVFSKSFVNSRDQLAWTVDLSCVFKFLRSKVHWAKV